jgi:phosphoribosylformimino-5-aminoimidazole carboxamide ribotide isomerase
VNPLRIIPAIDVRGGKCVRLVQGDYARETVFGDDPGEMARRWLGEGASSLHIVDLDGARDGRVANRRAVDSILAAVAAAGRPVAVDLGGGIRSVEDAAAWLEAGVGAVVLGTVAVEKPDVVSEVSRRFPQRVWVGIDAHAGEVKTAGWLEGSGMVAGDLARDAQRRGAAGIIYTDIDRDGTGKGVNVAATADLACAINIPVIASGGVDSVEDIVRLREQAVTGIEGVIVGRALYDGSVTLAELLEAAG